MSEVIMLLCLVLLTACLWLLIGCFVFAFCSGLVFIKKVELLPFIQRELERGTIDAPYVVGVAFCWPVVIYSTIKCFIDDRS